MKNRLWAILCWLMLCSPLLRAQATYTCQFWIDGDYAAHADMVSDSGNWHASIETSHLTLGLHTLYMHIQDTSRRWTSPRTFLFYRLPDTMSSEASAIYLYWFDQESAVSQQRQIGDGNLLIETSNLDVGFHTFNIQIGGERFARIKSSVFYKLPVTDSSNMTYYCWFDQDYNTLQQGGIGDGHILLETSSLPDGLHTLNVQLGKGYDAQLSSHLFMKVSPLISATDTAPLRWHYSIDGTDYPPISITHGERLIHLNLDVSTITDGLHTLSHFLMTESGNTLGLFTSFFYKIPVGGNGVRRYEYWYNDDYENKVSTPFASAVDTLRLIQLLDVDTLPFRSTSFHFDPHGGNPMAYAQNKISFRFWNKESYYVTREADFIDERVCRTILADTLERDTTKIIIAPVNNSIHWFKLYAGIGDSLSFLTDRHCTMQLFAPSGEEVFSSSGQDVLTWNGCHAWEDGVYYLAVHDAEGTGNISVSYQWIYRYAVLAWDVHRVGNGGISTITFEGNGFNSLDTVFLVKGIDTIPALYLDHKSNTTVGIVFNFEGADTGMYNAVFVYVDETLPVTNTVRVETALPIVLTSNVSYPSTFLRGSTVTYTYEITNTGNMTAYNVPLHIYIGTMITDGIMHVKIEGLGLKSIIDDFDLDSLSHDDIKEFVDMANEIGDDHYFYQFKGIKDSTDDSILIRCNYFMLTLAPYETKEIRLNIASNESIEAWMTVPDSIEPLIITESYNYSKSLYEGKSFREGYCCYKEHLDCFFNILGLGLDIASFVGPEIAIASCVLGAIQMVHSKVSTTICSNENSDILDGIRTALNWNSIIGTATSCAQKLMPWKKAKEIADIIGKIKSTINVSTNGMIVYDCLRALTKPKPNCPPGKHNGGESNPVSSLDPNDITGYLAESSSHAIGAEVKQLPYMIEFENDTAFATANAHTVVVRDTLDGSVFDLNSFSATAFGIGDEITPINGGQSFTRTMDMRPEINVLALVHLDYRIDSTFGVATWTFTSLNPMTLLPAADSLGFLGIGKTGEVDFTINRKADLPDSTVIDNRAWIVFDNEEPIATSTWRNIIDNTPPVSSIDSIAYSGSTATVTINATDNLSGVWRYNVYALMDGDVLLPMAMNVPIDSAAVFTTPDEVVQFRSTAIDSAGNVEPLVLTPLITTVYDTLTITACDNYTWIDSTYTTSGEYTKSKTATLRNAPDTITSLFLTINNSTTGTETASACDSYTWHGTTYTASTSTATYSTINALGCDSTITLHLTINNSTTSITTTTSCDSYTWHGTTYTASTNTPTYLTTNAAGCDSTVTLHLTINHSTTGTESITACDSYMWHGTSYIASTSTPTYLTTNAAGCDSTVTLHLTINHSTTGTETITACDSYTWHGTAYTASTSTPTYLTANAAGCDSTVTLHLTINHSITGTETITACDSYTWHGTAYTASTSTPTYTTTNTVGCDSTVTLHLTINNSTSAIETITACDSYTWHDSTYTASTLNSQFSTLNSVGCDSTVTLHLTINNSTSSTESITACDSYTWHGTAYTASTNSPTYLTTNATGCDSTVTLHLTINNSTTSTENVTACDSYTWHGTAYTTSTNTPTYTTNNTVGCDSTITLHLTINNSTTATEDITACDSYTWHDSTFTTSATDSFVTINAAGCDSTVTLLLIINYSTSSTESITACDSYTWHDSTFTTSTFNFQFSTFNSQGCDSTVTLHLTINYSSHDTVVDTGVNQYEWNGETYTESGEYIYEGQTEAGCDSIVVLQLTITNVGIADVTDLDGITIYPNPTTGKLTIDVEGVLKVEVYDNSGRLVGTFVNTNQLDLTHLPTGTYALRISLQKGNTVRRVIKQ